MPKIKIEKDKCKGCMLCIVACPKKFVVTDKKLNKRGVHYVTLNDKDGKCTGCAMCAVMCPDCCIEVYR
jgi:2-oxoglutarate ferredoxin oxidoreductase subunit delta